MLSILFDLLYITCIYYFFVIDLPLRQPVLDNWNSISLSVVADLLEFLRPIRDNNQMLSVSSRQMLPMWQRRDYLLNVPVDEI